MKTCSHIDPLQIRYKTPAFFNELFMLYFDYISLSPCTTSRSSAVSLTGESQSSQDHTETAPTEVAQADDSGSGKYSELGLGLNDLTFGPLPIINHTTVLVYFFQWCLVLRYRSCSQKISGSLMAFKCLQTGNWGWPSLLSREAQYFHWTQLWDRPKFV